MVYRKRTYRKRTYRKRRYNIPRLRSSMIRPYQKKGQPLQWGRRLSPIGFPREYWCKLCYDERITIPTGTAGFWEYQYVLNSLYDPNSTGTGSQPTFFDQICNANLYHRYQVYGVKWRVIFLNSDNVGMQIATFTTPDASSPGTGISGYLCQPGSKSKIMSFATGNVSSASISGYNNIAKTVGLLKQAQLNTSMGAQYNAAPSTLCYLNIAGQTTDDAAPSGTMWIQLKFYCKFSNLQMIAQS